MSSRRIMTMPNRVVARAAREALISSGSAGALS